MYNDLCDLLVSFKEKNKFTGLDSLFLPSGDIDTKKLSPLFLKHEKVLNEIEKLIHPWVEQEFYKRCDKFSLTSGFIFYESALVVETGFYKKLHSTLLVSCSREIRTKRLSLRGTQDEAVSAFLERRQFSEEKKKEYCEYTIDSECSIEELERRVKDFCFNLGKNRTINIF